MKTFTELRREFIWEAAKQGWDVEKFSPEAEAIVNMILALAAPGPFPGLYVKVTSTWALVWSLSEAWPDEWRGEPSDLHYRIDTARWYRENVRQVDVQVKRHPTRRVSS